MFNSSWLVYIFYLSPLIALGLMVIMVILLAYNWRALSDAIGYGMAGRRKQQRKKKGRSLQIVIWLAAWLVAIEVLTIRCGGIFCNPSLDISQTPQIIKESTGSGTGLTLPFIQAINGLGDIVHGNWFTLTFVALVLVSSVIFVRAVAVSWKERGETLIPVQPRQEGVSAVEEAIQILESTETMDPRTRIINCYQRMVRAAQQLGARVTSDQTARELEAAISKTLSLKGPAINQLTDLFEEARYSLHPITDTDGEKAHQYMLSIAEEMRIPVSV